MRRLLAQFVLLLSLFDGALLWADPADDQFAVASAHYRRARWQLAATEFGDFLRRYAQDPRGHEARFFLAEASSQLGQHQQALAAYRRFLAAGTNSPYAAQARFRIGESLLMLGRLAEARQELAKFHSQHPDHDLNAYTLVYLGQISLRLTEYKLAIDQLEDSLQRYPDGPLADDGRLALGQAEQAIGKSKRAGASYRNLAANSKHAEVAQFNLAVLHYGQQDYKTAAREFGEYLQRFPSSHLAARARLGQAWSYYQTHDWAAAVPLFERVTKSESAESCEAHYGLAMVSLAKHEFAAAGPRFERLLEDYPNHPLAETIAYHAADARLREDQHEAAVAAFDRHLKKWPSGKWSGQALLGKLLACESLGWFDSAAEAAEQFLAQEKTRSLSKQVSRAYGRVLVKQQRFAAAVDVLEPLYESAPSPRLSYTLALARLGTGRHQQSNQLLLDLLDDKTGVPRDEVLTALAALEIDRQQFAKAADYLKQNLAEDLPPASRHAACQQRLQCLLSADNLEEAIRGWTELRVNELPVEIAAPLALTLAEALFAANDFVAAEEQFTWLGEHADDDHRAQGYAGQAWCQFKRSEFGQCIASCDKLIASNGTLAAEALLLKGDAQARSGNDTAALATLLHLLETYPNATQSCMARWRAAQIHSHVGQHDEAFDLYMALVEQQASSDEPEPQLPKLDELLYQAAWTRFDASEPANAVSLLEQIHHQCPNSERWGDATYRLAEQAYQNGQLEKSNGLLSKIILQDDRANLTAIRHRAMELSGLIAVATRDWERVDAQMQQLLAADPAQELAARAKYWCAEAAWQRQSFPQAEQRFSELPHELLDASLQAKSKLRLAQRHFQCKRYLKALDIAESLLASNTPDVPADELQLVVGRCLAMRADFDAARNAYRQVIHVSGERRTETAAMAQWLIGETHFHQKQYEPALREYLRVEILYAWPEWQATALLQAGKCYEQLGQWPEAIETYRRILDTWPNATVASDASARLNVAQRKLKTPPRTARGTSPANAP